MVNPFDCKMKWNVRVAVDCLKGVSVCSGLNAAQATHINVFIYPLCVLVSEDCFCVMKRRIEWSERERKGESLRCLFYVVITPTGRLNWMFLYLLLPTNAHIDTHGHNHTHTHTPWFNAPKCTFTKWVDSKWISVHCTYTKFTFDRNYLK